MTVKINLNDFVKFKLTDRGKDIYYHQHDEINMMHGRKVIEPHYPETDEDGYCRMQLWKFMQIYGPYIGMGFNNVIMPLDLELCGEGS